jgi:hypothetical protein
MKTGMIFFCSGCTLFATAMVIFLQHPSFCMGYHLYGPNSFLQTTTMNSQVLQRHSFTNFSPFLTSSLCGSKESNEEFHPCDSATKERKISTHSTFVSKHGLETGINSIRRMSLLGILIVPLFFTVCQPSFALDPFIYANEYEDPLHPLCERRIQVAEDGKTFHYSGTAVGPKGDPIRRGCTEEEIQTYKLRRGSFDGYILDDGTISAGDGIHEGVWEPAGSVSPDIPFSLLDGIRWNDGNKWTVKEVK